MMVNMIVIHVMMKNIEYLEKMDYFMMNNLLDLVPVWIISMMKEEDKDNVTIILVTVNVRNAMDQISITVWFVMIDGLL